MSAKSCLTSFDFFGLRQSVFSLMTVGKVEGRWGVECGHALRVMLEWFFATPVKASPRGRGGRVSKFKMFAKTPFRAPHCCLLVKPSFPTMWGTDKNGKRMRGCQLTSFRHWATFRLGHLSWFVQWLLVYRCNSRAFWVETVPDLNADFDARSTVVRNSTNRFSVYLPVNHLRLGGSVCLLEWMEAVQPRLMLQLLWIVHSSGRFPQYSFGLP